MNLVQSQRLSGLRVVLNWLVVVLHAWAAFQYIPDAKSVPIQWNVANWLSNSFAMSLLPTLFFISGYLFALNNDGSWLLTGRKIKSRVTSLAVPYLLWNATFIAIYVLLAPFFPRLSDRVQTMELHSVWGCVNSLVGITKGPIDGPLWFIRNVLVMLPFTPFLYWLLRIRGPLVLVMLGTIMLWKADANPQWHPYCLFFFAAGMFGAIKGIAVQVVFNKFAPSVIPVFLMFSFVDFCYAEAIPALRYIFYMTAIPFWMACSRWFAMADQTMISRFIAPASFFLYAGHFLFSSITLHVLAPRMPQTDYLLSELYVLFVCVGGSACVVSFWVLKWISPTVCAWYSGGRT